MAGKKFDIGNSAAGKKLTESTGAAERGDLDTSKLDGAVLNDPKPPDGVELAPVVSYAVKLLKPHPANDQLFNELPPDELERLKADIRDRGVLVPIIATKDGVILSGHRRAAIAKELGRTFVPVQFVNGDLTAGQAREFLVKDNLLRRHLTTDERKKLIIALYGDELDKDRRGGDRKSKAAKSKFQSEILIDKPEPLQDKIERETGIKAGTAGRIVADIRKERKGETPQKTKPEKKARDPLKIVRAHLGKIVLSLDGADRETLDAAIIEIVETLDKFGIDPRYSPQVKEIVQNVRER